MLVMLCAYDLENTSNGAQDILPTTMMQNNMVFVCIRYMLSTCYYTKSVLVHFVFFIHLTYIEQTTTVIIFLNSVQTL